MKISEFKYVLMELGGGWEYCHNLYGIKENGEIYHTTDFVGITPRTELNMNLAGKMNKEDVVFEYPQNPTFVIDSPTYHILEVLGEGDDDLNLLYRKEDDNVELIEKVRHVIFDYDLERRMKLLFVPNWTQDKRALEYSKELINAKEKKEERIKVDKIKSWLEHNFEHCSIEDLDGSLEVKTGSALFLIVEPHDGNRNRWLLRASTISAFDRWANSTAIERSFETEDELCNYLGNCQTYIYKKLLNYLSEEYEDLHEAHYDQTR